MDIVLVKKNSEKRFLIILIFRKWIGIMKSESVNNGHQKVCSIQILKGVRGFHYVSDNRRWIKCHVFLESRFPFCKFQL